MLRIIPFSDLLIDVSLCSKNEALQKNSICSKRGYLCRIYLNASHPNFDVPFPYFQLYYSNHLIIGGPKVYDVTKYLDDHPGGAEVLLDVAGQDADEFFEDIGHSKEARKELSKYLIGNFKLDAAAMEKMKAAAEKRSKSEGGMVSTLLVALIAIVGVAVAYYKTQQSAGAEEK